MAESRAEAKQKLASSKADEKDVAEAKAAQEKKEADDKEAEGKVEDVEDVLQPTGGAEGSLEESKAKEEEAKNEGKSAKQKKADAKKAEEEESNEDETPKLERDLNAEAAPFAGTAVAGSTEKTFAQQGQLYTDGLSGDADHNLDRAYGSGA